MILNKIIKYDDPKFIPFFALRILILNMPKVTMNHNLYIISIPLNRLADSHFIIEKIGLGQNGKN